MNDTKNMLISKNFGHLQNSPFFDQIRKNRLCFLAEFIVKCCQQRIVVAHNGGYYG